MDGAGVVVKKVPVSNINIAPQQSAYTMQHTPSVRRRNRTGDIILPQNGLIIPPSYCNLLTDSRRLKIG
jgi:hypothetical protein